ncbi:glycosyltransferase family 2 protein [Aquabacter spiritensis]|uniref:Glycosyl transferase family 2 n=1 Tax=Aquabacter spiritensis TaxID=933073 RepID=A0A4R3LTU0_9HYPH|nr:glycosyltransferase family 2 protein [Aquabacter spiritensis]TCT03972.1 glycosyl transferase family 2 [Aquabacter spiritensis]
MVIAESDISILIPTYRYRDKVVRAVDSALASGAGEIIVLDDHGRDGTIERLAAYSDPRLIVRENDRNLGLWENHLAALHMARRPWIKFIQADDYLLPGGLAAFAAAVDEGVSIVFGCPLYKNEADGRMWEFYHTTRPHRLTSRHVQEACFYFGWLLGSPSQILLRRAAIMGDPAIWRSTMSADFVIGAITAAHGDTVILPPGTLVCESHGKQDSATETALLWLERTANSTAYLKARPEQGLRRLANGWVRMEAERAVRKLGRGILRREAPVADLIAAFAAIFKTMTPADLVQIWRDRRLLRAAMTFRRTRFVPFDLDRLIPELLERRSSP